METLEHLKYPIGKTNIPVSISSNQIKDWINVLEEFPNKITDLVKDLDDKQLDTPYRPEGWTIRQVIHHLADSHHQSYTRFKWSLTEDNPLIKAYHQDRWAELIDSKTAPIEMSLRHLKAIHIKLVYVLKHMAPEDFDKGFIHPENNKLVLLKHNLALYAWHSNHHYEHINQLLIRKKWK